MSGILSFISSRTWAAVVGLGRPERLADGAATGRSETTQDGGFKLPEYTSDNTFNLKEALEKVEKHYIELAIKDAGHKKSKLARLLGMKNYQTVSHRLDKFGMEI